MPRVKKNCQDGYNSAFATRLRGLLDTPGMNQSMLAEHIGVTRQAVSAYSLGTSLPDIEKFEKIADYFGVSTEYLLGRTDIKKPDMAKQAVAEYLNLSEEAIDAIHHLQGIHFEQSPENNYKVTLKPEEPLPDMLSAWLEAVDLTNFTSSLYRAVMSVCRYNESGKHPDFYTLDQDEQDAFHALKAKDFIVLSLAEQEAFYTQQTVQSLHNSIDRLITEASSIVDDDENENEFDE